MSKRYSSRSTEPNSAANSQRRSTGSGLGSLNVSSNLSTIRCQFASTAVEVLTMFMVVGPLRMSNRPTPAASINRVIAVLRVSCSLFHVEKPQYAVFHRFLQLLNAPNPQAEFVGNLVVCQA